MLPFALLCAAVLHEPSPDDIHRFGFTVHPVATSIPRVVWNRTRENLAELRKPVSGWLIYGREQQYADAVIYAAWCERVWDAVDDMGRECCSAEGRMSAARRLRAKIGPVAYWLGELPGVD